MFKKLNLFSKTESKVLAFILHHDDEIYSQEVARQAKVSVGSANSILKKFARQGLVEARPLGRMILYRRNDQSATVRQMKVANTVEFLEKEVLRKIGPYSERAILFGSCAQGRNTEKSDIDLFILSAERTKIFEILVAYHMISPVILNSTEYSDLREKDKPLYERINGGIVLLGE